MPPRENGLGVPGQAASDAQQLQNVRQHSANAAGQQIYNNPTTPAGMDAQHKWNQNNPIPKQSIDTVYGGVNYGNKLQKDTEVAVDQEQIGRGGPGTASAMMRAGLLDANGYKPNTPGVNSRDTRSEADQYAEQNRVMADIKREGAEARARGEQFQPKGVNTVNPSSRVDISGDRRRLELKNGEPKFSRDEGGVNYAGPKKQPALLAAPTPAPVAKTTPPPAPTGYQWQSKEAEALYNKSFVPGQYNGTPGSNDPTIQRAKNLGILRPDGSYDFNAARAAGSQVTPPEVDLLNKQNQAPTTGGGVPPNQNSAMAEFQAKNNARMKAEGSTRPPDDYTKLGAGEQKYVTDFNMERGNIPRPVRPPTGQVPNPKNPNKDMNDRPMLPKAPGMAQGQPTTPSKGGLDLTFDDAGTPQVTPPPEAQAPKPMWEDPGRPRKINGGLPIYKGGENILDVKPQGPYTPESPPQLQGSPKPYTPPRATPKPASTPVSREIDFQNRTPNSAEMMENSRSREYSGNSGADKIRDNVPYFGENFGAQQVRPPDQDNKSSKPIGKPPSRVPQTPNFKEGMQFKSPIMQQFNTPKPVEGVDKMPTIRRSSPITDTIKASNNPVPVVDTPKTTQQAPAQRKPLFPRLRGRR